MKFFTLRVLEIKIETNDTVTVSFKQPALKKIKYKAGQYLTIVIRINGRRYLRPYSFSSCPLTDTDIEITVKRIPGGIVSNHIFDVLQAGDMIEVMEPLGSFTLNSETILKNNPVILWGAGSGITPLMSLLKSLLYQKPKHSITLVYGNKNSESIIFADKIKQLEKNYSNFKSWHFLTKNIVSDNNPYVIQGRISPEKISMVMQSITDVKNSIHYVCGPIGLKESIKHLLESLGVLKENIHSEEFEVKRNESDFEDIVTRNVKIIKNKIETLIEVVKGQSILEAGLDASIELPYSCQTGNCHICRARLIKGDVKLIGVENLPADIQSDEFLLCCSFPLTNDIEIILD